MARTSRIWYEVRVREHLDGDRYVKKSKFYLARGPREAASNYNGKGYVMWAVKVGRERHDGIGEFFKLGGDLLEDLRVPKLEDGKASGRQKRVYYRTRRK